MSDAAQSRRVTPRHLVTGRQHVHCTFHHAHRSSLELQQGPTGDNPWVIGQIAEEVSQLPNLSERHRQFRLLREI
jgi:hypothetical protein